MDRNKLGQNSAFVAGMDPKGDGRAFSYHRPPAPDLAPWIARFYVAGASAPDDHVLSCGLFHDTASLRVQLSGTWRSETLHGPRSYGRRALFVGPHSRRMPVSVTGGFISIGAIFRPGSCRALKGPSAADLLDCIADYDDIFGSEARIFAGIDPDASPEDWLTALENEIRALVDERSACEPDPVSAAFEAIAFSEPGLQVARIAQDLGVDQRRLQRIIRQDFGMAPKQVLRRARALDMATHLRGVGDKDEAEVLALRYYDQSHLIREFVELFGMSPSQFIAAPQPLLTAALESRQSRRLEMIERIAPGGIRPWE